MSDSTTPFSSTKSNNENLFSKFLDHTSLSRCDTKTRLLNLIRSNYPEHHVTEVSERYVSLFEFAKADKANFTFNGDDEVFNATRCWGSVGMGVEKKLHPGQLTDGYRFARFQYVWEGYEFIIYYAVWQDTFSSPSQYFYILAPRSSSTIADGHCAETDALILAAGKWTSQLHDEIFVFDDGHWDKSKELFASVVNASWDDVILDPEMKKGLIEDVQGFFDNQEIYKQFAVPWKRGVILHGVPGNGKTVSIKALMSALYAREDSIPSLYVKTFETSCNTAQYSVSQIFSKARSMTPCLLVFEDLDSLVNDDVRSYFLNEVDGLESNDGILMIGSTNHLDKLDPAISKRPSRFDRKYHFKIPGEEERRLYAQYWRAKLTKNETVEFPEELTDIVAKLTEGFSFAYLKELFVMALLSLVRGFKGEDYEIVDKDEAASADGNDTPSSGEMVDGQKDDDVCTCKAKCATCDKPLPPAASGDSEAAKKADEAKEAKGEVKKNKLAMPTVEIPEALAENLLLKVIKHHIRVLHSEMDNTEDESGGKKKDDAPMTKAAVKKMMRGGYY